MADEARGEDSAEVRKFARPNPSPLVGEGDSPTASRVRGEAKDSEAGLSAEGSAKAGMAEMSKRYRKCGDLYELAAKEHEQNWRSLHQ